MELQEVVTDIAAGLSALDAAGGKFRDFQPGIGPFGEPQLVKAIATYLNSLPRYSESVRTKKNVQTCQFQMNGRSRSKSHGHTATMAKKQKTGRSISCTRTAATLALLATASSSRV